MHVVIINGSPRVQKYSNTEQIIAAFAKGLSEKGITFEAYAISNRKTWDTIRDAYIKNDEILIALPLYVECVPGLLLEFLETLPKKDEHTRLSFLLQSGFAEGCQLRCGEEFLAKLPEYLGVRYGGCLVKGDNFCIRFWDEKRQAQVTKPYQAMGKLFAEGDGFLREEAKKFTGPEYFPLPIRLMMGLIFKTFVKKCFRKRQRRGGAVCRLTKKYIVRFKERFEMSHLPQISEAEFEVMKIVWKHAPISTNEITDKLLQTTSWSPKTIQTLIKRLVTKGALTYEKQSRMFVYTPVVKESEYIGQESNSFLKRYYDGDITAMLSAYIENDKLSETEIEHLRSLLSKRRSKGGD